MALLLLLDAHRWSKGRGERRAPGLAQGAGSSDFLQKACRGGADMMAARLVTARDGKSREREGRKE